MVASQDGFCEGLDMYGVRMVGKYNVDYEGRCYDRNIPYEMVIIEEFNGNLPVKGRCVTLYFRCDGKYIVPDMKTEAEVEEWLHYRNHDKIKAYKKIAVEEVTR